MPQQLFYLLNGYIYSWKKYHRKTQPGVIALVYFLRGVTHIDDMAAVIDSTVAFILELSCSLIKN